MKFKDLPLHVRAAAERGKGSAPIAPKKRRRGVMNKTEAAYARELEARKQSGEIRWWDFEPMTLRIARDAKFTPDFAVFTAAGDLEFHETKGGFIREAAMVRLKVAAAIYPFRFVLVRFGKNGQTFEEMPS